MSDEFAAWRSMPPQNTNETVLTEHWFQAVDNMARVFAIRPDDTLLFLSDPLIDPRVFSAIAGLARARGVRPEMVVSSQWNSGRFPDELKALYEKSSLVVSTWFASIGDPYCLKVRRDSGQRTVKMTYFRSIDVLRTPQARFPAELVGEITRATRDLYPRDEPFTLHITDPRGTDWAAQFTPEMRENMLSSNRWRGQMTAEEPGAYVHWVPTHGPNIYDRTTLGARMDRGATPGSERYPSNCPRTTSLDESVRTDLKSFTCSSRVRSMSPQYGGSMQRKLTTCMRWFWMTSRIVPVAS